VDRSEVTVSQVAFASWLVALTLAAAQAALPAPAPGQISGRVLDDATYQPLANARVFLYPNPFPAGGRPASTMTNQDGDFAFTTLQSGSYRLGTHKLGFFPTLDTGMPLVTLAESGEQVTIDLTMSKGGSLAGRVLDQSGRPLKGMWVGAPRVVGLEELEQAIPSVSVARTNDVGEYRVESLHPGQFVIVANPGHGPIGPVAGGITDSRTFFPGTLDFAKARRVTIGPAQTVAGLDFEMITAPTFEVSGIAVDGAGRTLAGALVALVADWSLFGGPKGSSRTDPEGQFRIPRLAAGRYKLMVTRPGEEPKPVTRETPFIRVNVIDADINGLVVPVPIR
jgi:protocatechuate 3,4-dioxygenase beta subunit